MKKIVIFIGVLFSFIFVEAQNVGIGTATPTQQFKYGNNDGYCRSMVSII